MNAIFSKFLHENLSRACYSAPSLSAFIFSVASVVRQSFFTSYVLGKNRRKVTGRENSREGNRIIAPLI
jgi:hypothetical protein